MYLIVLTCQVPSFHKRAELLLKNSFKAKDQKIHYIMKIICKSQFKVGSIKIEEDFSSELLHDAWLKWLLVLGSLMLK